MVLNDWFAKWGVPEAARRELQQLLEGDLGAKSPEAPEMSEQATAQRVLLTASQHGARLYRNNNGALKDENGRWVWYGLGSTPKKPSGSSDYIGFFPLRIQQHHVGRIVPVFLSVETKKPGWAHNPKDQVEARQANWIRKINAFGGVAGFVCSSEDLTELLKKGRLI